MIKRLRGRRPVAPIQVDTIQLAPIEVHHVVSHKPKPMPTQMYGIIINDVGERWTLQPQPIHGQAVFPVYFPLVFLTGRREDNGKQAGIEFRLEYERGN